MPFPSCPLPCTGGGGGGTRYILGCERCGATPHTLTLFKTNIADFPTLFKTEFQLVKILLFIVQVKISCLRQKLMNRYPD